MPYFVIVFYISSEKWGTDGVQRFKKWGTE